MYIQITPEDKNTKCSICKEITQCKWWPSLKKYICNSCTSQQRYSATNKQERGRPQKKLPRFSFEFEIASPEAPQNDLEDALPLLYHGFIRSYDGTVSDEYKSPIYGDSASAQAALNCMHAIRHLVNDKCGTHIHVECHSKYAVHKYSGEIFSPLLTRMLNNPQETVIFWGRDFNNYAGCDLIGRYFAFNTDSNYPTLEFRLPRFRTKDQFLMVLRFARLCVAVLDKRLPPAEKNLALLPQIGQKILTLYQSLQPLGTTWFAELEEHEEKEALVKRLNKYPWRKRL